MNSWNIVIGLEIHAQINSESKLFSNASTKFGAEPNSQVNFIDAGMPGMLPVVNKTCINQAIKTGLAINGTINKYSQFDRKNYFYPDLPNGYQISQFYHPIVSDGSLEIEIDNQTKKTIRIERIHIEQDAGKLIHDLDPNSSLIDLNRAGVGLMEIVTKPDINSIEEATLFLKKLRTLLRYIGSSNADMEKGQMRVDVNISVHKPNTPLGTRCEIKNVNSIKFISQAIQYEANRQIELLESGRSIQQETRLFDPEQGVTKTMRTKEDALDYRYFPDPDLPPLILNDDWVATIRSNLPLLPSERLRLYQVNYNLPKSEAIIIADDYDITQYFETMIANNCPPLIGSKWMINELFAMLKKYNFNIDNSPVTPQQLSDLCKLIESGKISGKIAKTVFEILWTEGGSAEKIVADRNLEQVDDSSLIENLVINLIKNNPDKVSEYKSGKERLFGWFVGQILKESQGKANPDTVNLLLKKHLTN